MKKYNDMDKIMYFCLFAIVLMLFSDIYQMKQIKYLSNEIKSIQQIKK